MSDPAIRWAVNARLRPTPFRVLLTIAELADDYGVANCSYSELEHYAKVSRSTIIRTVRQLKADSFLVVERRVGGADDLPPQHRPSLYVLNLGVDPQTLSGHPDHSRGVNLTPLGSVSDVRVVSVTPQTTPYVTSFPQVASAIRNQGCQDDHSDPVLVTSTSTSSQNREPLRGPRAPRDGASTIKEVTEMGWGELFKDAGSSADDPEDGVRIGSLREGRMSITEFETAHRLPGESIADFGARLKRLAPVEFIHDSAKAKTAKPIDRWNAGDLNKYFAALVEKHAPGYTSQCGPGPLGRHMKQWISKGTTAREIRAAMDLFFEDPRNLAQVGKGFPLWQMFYTAMPTIQRQARIRAGVQSDTLQQEIENADEINAASAAFLDHLLGDA